ncbi:MAG: ribose 5-phosphate isomerase B [Deltaproteobacteria bacterium]|nr:MAG: ribose 5-phosphate isomerase B [Deltaproteobacteria bacterium]
MKVYLGADHGGYQLKEQLKQFLLAEGHQVGDFGCHSTESVDYPDFALLVARAVAGAGAGGGAGRGIMIDSIGQASALVANKVAGVRAVVGFSLFAVESARSHNDANLLCLGGQVLGVGLARALVQRFLDTPFAGGRHQKRLDKITEIERLARGK